VRLAWRLFICLTHFYFFSQARWQQDTHFKLQKFANLCKDLNEEAALRNEEALSLHQELGVIRSERDEMATEIEKLKGQLAIQERREQEHGKVEETLKEYEQKGLDGADKAIQSRDAIILDLAGRLERALDTLDVEREHQRQRRKIIFPAARASITDTGDERESELKETKEALRESLSAMDAMRHDSHNKEIAWKARIESLERQVVDATFEG
jgi:cell division protein FtsB